MWLRGAWYDGFDVGGSRLRLGPMPDGIVGVVVGVGRGVSGCNSPVSSDSGCEVMPGALVRYMYSWRGYGDGRSDAGDRDAVRWLGDGVE